MMLQTRLELAIEKGTGLAAEMGTGWSRLAEGEQVKLGKFAKCLPNLIWRDSEGAQDGKYRTDS